MPSHDPAGAYSYELSPTQLAMLLHAVRDPRAGLWVEQATLRLTLKNVDAFQRAWQRVVDRHDVLRTAFRWEGLDTPLQVVVPAADLPVETDDWRDVDAAEQERRLNAYLAVDSRRGFDLEVAPLLRLMLARVGEREWICVKSHHHIVMDAWSGAAVLGEVEEIIQAERRGREALLPPVGQYGAYIAWLRRQDQQGAERFWRRQLAGFTEPLALPGERAGRSLPTDSPLFVGHRLTLSTEATAALRSLALRWRVTVSSIAQAAWALVLSTWSGETDVVFGVTSSGRPPDLDGVERMIGLFITTLPVRTRVDLQRRAADWVRDLHAQFGELRSFENVSPLALQAWSDVPRNVPLFESLVTYNSAAIGRRDLWLRDGGAPSAPSGPRGGGLQTIARPEPSNHPLSVAFAEVGDAVTIDVTADNRRVEAGAPVRLLEQLRTVLEDLPSQPQGRLRDVAVLPRGERTQLLRGWNATRVEVPSELCLHELVRAAARRDPEAPAVVTGDGVVTIGWLDRQANRLARHLVARGVGAEVLVAVALDRSVELFVAMLAVLKAGGGCLPLDPGYPRARRQLMLEDSGATLIITDGRLQAEQDYPDVPALRLPADEHLWKDEGDQAPEGGADPENPAFVLYTSGSTGTPKGVVIPHRVCVNRLYVEGDPLTPDDVLCCTTSPNFIDSIWESFGAWVHGARTVLVPPAEVPDPERFVELVGRAGVTRLLTVPSLLRTILESGAATPERLPQLRVWISSGEALPRDLSKLFVETFPDRVLSDLYGTTETWDVTRFDASAYPPGEPLPIGRPFGNATAYVLDGRMRPVPIGAAGELYVGGDGLSRGYHRRPGLTAERFLPNPFAEEPGARLYRTGDRARWRPDGQLELLGRIDHQIKVRGFRVEPGEIEGVLRMHPQVHRAAVAVTDRSQLAAWIVAAPGETPSAVDLRTHVRAHVPAHQVPSIYRFLDRIPLTPSGKLDRPALTSLTTESEDRHQAQVQPEGELVRTVASAWAEVLGVDEVGPDDDFFELGGHSLLVAQLTSRLRERLGRAVPVRAVFEAPTVTGLAEWLTSSVEEEPDDLPDLVSEGTRPDGRRVAPQSFAQKRLWFLGQLAPGSPLYTTRGAMPLPGQCDPGALRRALDLLVARHEILRTTFDVAADGELVQLVQPSGTVSLAVLDGRAGAAEPVAQLRRWWQADGSHAFDVVRGPLARFALLRSGNQHVLAWSLHHLVTDGWSTSILRREIRAFYTEFRDGREPELDPLPVQYADFATWQHRALQGEFLERQLDYWRTTLAGAPPALDLPTDRPRRPVAAHRAARSGFRIDRDLAEGLEVLGRDEDATLFMILLAGFSFVLGRHAGKDDVVVGSPVANRPRTELEGLIGLFVNTLALRTDLSGRPSFRELLRRVRETCVGAYAHQDLPFERLVDELAPERDLATQPVCQVLLSLLSTPRPPDEVGASSSAGPGPDLDDAGTMFFDLTLTMTQSDAGLVGELHYSADLFDASTATRLVDHLTTLLETVVREPDAPLTPAALIGPAERGLLLDDWARRPAPPADRCVHELVEDCAGRDPDHPAVRHHGAQVTYAQLDRLANQLAHRLLRLGVRPEERVALLADPSPAAVAAVLAIFKAGGVYVPLDPATPGERLSWLLEDAAPTVLICDPSYSSLAPPGPAVVLPLTPDGAELDEPTDRPAVPVAPEWLAYLVYTSGSTGRAKGVLVEHRNLAHTVRAQAPLFGLSDRSRVLATIAWTFDASLGEIFRTLTSGATLVLADRDEVLPGPGLLELWRDEHVDVSTVATAVLAALPRQPAVPELRTLTVGGEALPADLAAHWMRERRLLNGYGPTETTIGATLTTGWPAERRPPLGRPLPGVAAYVLDEDLQLQPVGVPGELCLAGPGVSRGYLHRGDLTGERFLPDPFGTEPGSRMYRTGDRVRWLPDGELEFLGRLDEQVKIRGHRVEPEEVRSTLRQQPGVRDAVVIARENSSGQHQLVAYTVGDAEPAELMASLRASLPEHLVPSTFVVLSELPRTPNGKLDRKALPNPDVAERPRLAEYVAPRSPQERALAGIWADLLRVERVGVHDNFFDLGGDSLLSVRVMARAHEAGLRLATRDLYRLQTVAEQAVATGRAATVEAPQEPVTGAVPLTPMQHWFLDHDDPEPDRFTWAGLVRAPAELTRARAERALLALLRHHDALRLRFERSASGTWRQFLTEPGSTAPPLTVVDLREHPPAERLRVLEARTAQLRGGLNLRDGPILRLVWFRSVAEHQDPLVLVVHHLAVDTLSWPIVLGDLTTLLHAPTGDDRDVLPAKTCSVQQWAHHLVAAARSDTLQAELPLWLHESRRRIRPLPRDHRGRNSRSSERELTTTSGVGETTALRQAVQLDGVTLEEALLSALAGALSRWTGSRELMVNVERHGREDLGAGLDMARTVGWLPMLVPALLHRPQDVPAREAARLVHEHLSSLPHHGIGHGLLRYLGPEETQEQLKALPPAEVFFCFHGHQRTGPEEASGATGRPLDLGPSTGAGGDRRHLLELNAVISRGRLVMRWTYSDTVHERATVEALAADCLAELGRLVPVSSPESSIAAESESVR
ncbi:amino acid adenylation domain-containing protein [Nocardioides sp.]|uniref:amino acid adenylation domain-containing protein n=1 Tax=Nocardioides sp. TaxID=35761 RepID=UPI0031FE6C26